MKEPEVSEKFSISAEIYDDEATHGYRPLSCRRARIIKSLLFLVYLKTNAQNTSKKFLVETCGHIELRTMMIKYNFFFMIPRAFPFLSLHMRYILSYKAIIINAVSYWHIAKRRHAYMNILFLSYSRAYESISLFVATLVQMKTRMNGKVSAISNENYYFGSIIFVIPTKHLKCVKHKAICGSFNWQREKPKSHRRFSIFDSNHF